MQFLPELTLLGAGLVIFLVSLGKTDADKIKTVAICLGAAVFAATLLSFRAQGSLFYDAYKIDLYSQIFKCLIAGAMFVVLILGRKLKDIKNLCTSRILSFPLYKCPRAYDVGLQR